MSPTPLFAIYLVWALWGVSWLLAARWRAPAAQASTTPRVIPPLIIAGLGFFALFIERPATPPLLWRLPTPVAWATVALAAASAAFAWWARVHLGRLWSGGIVRREGHCVVESGPYAYVRHPMYTALIVAAAAIAAIRATPIAFAGVPLIAIGFAWKARIEERFLAAELGEDAYAAYRARVPMLLPRP